MTYAGRVLAVITRIDNLGKYVMFFYNGGSSKLFDPNQLSYNINDKVAGVFLEVTNDNQAVIHGRSWSLIENFFKKEGISVMPGHIPCNENCWGELCGRACGKPKALAMN